MFFSLLKVQLIYLLLSFPNIKVHIINANILVICDNYFLVSLSILDLFSNVLLYVHNVMITSCLSLGGYFVQTFCCSKYRGSEYTRGVKLISVQGPD